MENHGINMKGKFFMEEVSNEAVDSNRRLAYNTSTSMGGSADAFGQYKMFYHNESGWLRPLCGNVSDGPDVDNTRYLGSSSYRFARIYSTDFYGQVRYS